MFEGRQVVGLQQVCRDFSIARQQHAKTFYCRKLMFDWVKLLSC